MTAAPRNPTAILQMANPATGELAKLKRTWHEFTLSPEATLLLEQTDGRTAIRHLLAALDGRVTPELARGCFARMHAWGPLLYARVPFVEPKPPTNQTAPHCANGTAPSAPRPDGGRLT
jgi:hypothetical protein